MSVPAVPATSQRYSSIAALYQVLPARQLIERHGPQKLLKELAARLYCRRCQEKYCHCRGRNFEAMVSLPYQK